MSRLFVATVLFCLAVPAALAAPPAGQDQGGGSAQKPSQLCAEQLRTMGAASFQSTYAPNGNGKNAFGKCVSRQAQASSADQDNAAKKCKAERESMGVEKFNDQYGTNPNKKNAFGKCVSGYATEQAEDRQDATLNAAKKCKAERAPDPAAFTTKYGTNPNKKNAFGKCVSKHAKQGATP